MPWSGMMRSGIPRESSKRAQRFEPADRMIVNAFADLRRVHYLKCILFTEACPHAVEHFERRVWKRLIDYLVKLPPLPSDD